MLGAQQLLSGEAVHTVCLLPLEDDVTCTTGILQAPPQVLLVAKNNTIEVYELDLPAADEVPATITTTTPPSSVFSSRIAPSGPLSRQLRSLGHAVDFGSPVLAMTAIPHQCFVVWTASQELVVLRYQGNLPGGREAVIGRGPSCATSLESLKSGIAVPPSPLDWTAEAGQHWSGLHHRHHWMVIHSTSLTDEHATQGKGGTPCANPSLAPLSLGLNAVVVAHVYEGVVHRVLVAFHDLTNREQLAEQRQRGQGPSVRVLDNFYSDRWTGLSVAADFTLSAIRPPQPFTSSGLSGCRKGESTQARRERVHAQWKSFSYQDIADEELLLQHSITELTQQKAALAEHLPAWRVRRDSRLPTVTVDVTKLRESYGAVGVLPLPALHHMPYPDTFHWALYYLHKPHLCVYRHPGHDPSKMQCFQKPNARSEGAPVYLCLAVPSATAGEGSGTAGQLVLFQQTHDGSQCVRVEDLNTFRLGLETTGATQVASCTTRAVSALLLEGSRTLWAALDDGTLSCFPLPEPCTDRAVSLPTQQPTNEVAGGDCEAQPWPRAPPVRGLPAHFVVRRMQPLELGPSPSSYHFMYASTTRYAIFDDQLAEVFVVDLVRCEVVAALRGWGAMTAVCEGVNGSLVTAHVNGVLSRVTAVAPTSLLARLYRTAQTREGQSQQTPSSSSSSSCASSSGAPAAAATEAANVLVDGLFPLVLPSSATADEGCTALHVLVSLNTGRSALYRCRFHPCTEQNKDVALSSLELVDTPPVTLLSAAPTLAALSFTTAVGPSLVQCTPDHLNAFGAVTALDGPVWHAALGEVGTQGCVAALVRESSENAVELRALMPDTARAASTAPTTTATTTVLSFDSTVSAVAVVAQVIADDTDGVIGGAGSTESVQDGSEGRQKAAWCVCLVTALWDGSVHVHLLQHDVEAGWTRLAAHALHAPLSDADSSPSHRQAPNLEANVWRQLTCVPSMSSSSSSSALWCLQFVTTTRADGELGVAPPAQLLEVCVARRASALSRLETVRWRCLPSPEGPAGTPPLAQIACPITALTLREAFPEVEKAEPCTTAHANVVQPRTARPGALHVALMHECYAELVAFTAPSTHVAGGGESRLAVPTASIRVDAHATDTRGSSSPLCSFDVHWRSAAVVACGFEKGATVGSVTHVLFAASAEGGLAVVGLPDVLTQSTTRSAISPPPSSLSATNTAGGEAEAAWTLSTVVPSRFVRTQVSVLSAVSAGDALVRVLPSVPVASLGGCAAPCAHVCCIDRGAHQASLMLAVCPHRLLPVDALQLTQTTVDGQVHPLIATCMDRVPEREGPTTARDATARSSSDVVLVGARVVAPDATSPPHWLLVLGSSPLRVLSAVSVPVTDIANAHHGPGSATGRTPSPGIADMAVYRRHARATLATPTDASEPSAEDDCVLVVVAGGSSVFLYELHGHSLLGLSRVRCSALCTSIAFSYPSISVGLGGDGYAFLWVLSLTETAAEAVAPKSVQSRSRAAVEDVATPVSSPPSGAEVTPATSGVVFAPPQPLRSPHSVDDLNAILHRSDTRDAVFSEDGSTPDDEEDEEEEEEARRLSGPVPRDDGTTPFNPDDERRKRFDQSKLATVHSPASGLSLVVGAYEPTVLAGGTGQRGYRERFVRIDDSGGVCLVYPHPPASRTQMDQSSVGMRGGTSCIVTHCIRLPSVATSITVASPMKCRAVRRAQPRALQWSERWVALCAAETGPRTILLPCVDGSLHALTEAPYGLAHPLLRLEQVLTDLHTYRLEPSVMRTEGDDDFFSGLRFTYHVKPFSEETSLRSGTRLVPKQGVVSLETLQAFFAWCEIMRHPLVCARHPRALIALEHTVQLVENVLFEEYGDELTLEDCEEMVAGI